MASILQIVLNRGIHTLKVLPGLTGVDIIKFSSSPESWYCQQVQVSSEQHPPLPRPDWLHRSGCQDIPTAGAPNREGTTGDQPGTPADREGHLPGDHHQQHGPGGWAVPAGFPIHIYNLSKLVRSSFQLVSDALASYEEVCSEVSGAGVDIVSKDFSYNWDYTQSAFFSLTILTTIGDHYNHYTITIKLKLGNFHQSENYFDTPG